MSQSDVRSEPVSVDAAVVVAPRPIRSAVRWLLAGLGILCFALGAIGAVVPGLPTTVFLIAGSYLLARSCPWIERRLRALPLVRRYATYLDPNVPMPWAVKRRALVAMWASILVATALLVLRESTPRILVAVVPAAGLIGTWVVIRFRPERPDGDPPLS